MFYSYSKYSDFVIKACKFNLRCRSFNELFENIYRLGFVLAGNLT